MAGNVRVTEQQRETSDFLELKEKAVLMPKLKKEDVVSYLLAAFAV